MYSYQCPCGVLFDASAPASRYKDPKPCPDCGKPAARQMPKDVGGVFEVKSNGPAPQNTGISSFDAKVDRVIGQHAKQGWEAEDKRRAAKRKVLTTSGAKTEDLSMNPDGSYRVRKPDEKAVHERAVAINNLATKTLRDR